MRVFFASAIGVAVPNIILCKLSQVNSPVIAVAIAVNIGVQVSLSESIFVILSNISGIFSNTVSVT